jgi:hypothetical protein
MLIGGRHLGAASDPSVQISLALQSQPLETFDVGPGFFSRRIALRAGLLAGTGYVPLEIASRTANGSSTIIPVGLEQFDVQSPGMPMIAVDEGWYESEYNPRTARAWRWTSEKAVLWVRPIGRNVTLTLSGESPLKYFDAAPVVVVSVGDHEVARFSPSSDFTQSVVLPADAVGAANGRVVITSDKFFVPAEREGSQDRRHLALRIYAYSVR